MNIKKSLYALAGFAASAASFVVARSVGAVSQFETATNAATLVATDLTTDMLTLVGKLVIMAGGIFLVVLIWRRSRRVANSETRIN